MSMSEAVFLSAVKSGNVQTVRRFIEQGGIDVNARINDQYGRTPIFYAKNVDIMRMLIASGAQVNSKDDFGMTPLHEKARRAGRENEACCELLLSNNADIEAESHSGRTPLHHVAADHAQLGVARLMLGHQRSCHGHEGISSLLAKTNVSCGMNALHYGVSRSSGETVRLLVEQCRGEDEVLVSACHQMMVAKDIQGRTPLDCARNRNNVDEVVKYLESFTRLTLADPAASSDGVAIMLNPRLDDFQHAIATECG